MRDHDLRSLPPILRDKHPQAASAFTPQNLLREARRQNGLPDASVPEVCVFDSITSSGQITALRPPPYFILIERALRDEGTSYRALPATDYAEAVPSSCWPSGLR